MDAMDAVIQHVDNVLDNDSKFWDLLSYATNEYLRDKGTPVSTEAETVEYYEDVYFPARSEMLAIVLAKVAKRFREPPSTPAPQ